MKNNYEVIGEDVFIEINQHGKLIYAIISKDDLDVVSKVNLKWYMSGGYVVVQPFINGKRTTIRLHRLIMDTPDDLLCDHIDRDTLNNRRSNLRNVTEVVNLNNKGVYKNTSSGVKGVSQKPNGTWRATVSIGGGKQKHLGTFKTKEEAIKIMTQG